MMLVRQHYLTMATWQWGGACFSSVDLKYTFHVCESSFLQQMYTLAFFSSPSVLLLLCFCSTTFWSGKKQAITRQRNTYNQHQPVNALMNDKLLSKNFTAGCFAGLGIEHGTIEQQCKGIDLNHKTYHHQITQVKGQVKRQTTGTSTTEANLVCSARF